MEGIGRGKDRKHDGGQKIANIAVYPDTKYVVRYTLYKIERYTSVNIKYIISTIVA